MGYAQGMRKVDNRYTTGKRSNTIDMDKHTSLDASISLIKSPSGNSRVGNGKIRKDTGGAPKRNAAWEEKEKKSRAVWRLQV